MLLNLTVIITGYLLGSIPSAYLMARFRKGADIRDLGVGNVGAANVFREIGRWEGAVVWIADTAKGSVAVLIALALNVPHLWLLGAGFAALLGHNFPVFIGFRGGKGVSTAMGIFLVLTPESIIITSVLVIIPFLITHRIFYGICTVAPLLPLLIWLFEKSPVLTFYALAILIFMGLRVMPSPRKLKTSLVRRLKEKH